ncbi:unnamed protein product, partial [Mesorhabditis spiculigera]
MRGTSNEGQEEAEEHEALENLSLEENNPAPPPPPGLIHPDISLGLERFCVPVFNTVDDTRLTVGNFAYTNRVLDSQGICKEHRTVLVDGCVCGRSCLTMDCCCSTIPYSDDGRLPMDQLNSEEYIASSKNTGVIFECAEACECSLQCGNRVAQKGAVHPVQIYRTEKKGWAVRTVDALPIGTFVGEYTGELKNEGDGSGEYLFETKIGEMSCTIDAKVFGNFTRFVNHSCSPNLYATSIVWDDATEPYVHICFFTLNDVEPGAELTVDYGSEWWRENIYKFPCRCGSSNCGFNEVERDKVLMLAEGSISSL